MSTSKLVLLSCIPTLAVVTMGCPDSDDPNAPPLTSSQGDPTDGGPYGETGAGGGSTSATGSGGGEPLDTPCSLLAGSECSGSEKCVPVGHQDAFGFSPWLYAACRPVVATGARQVGQDCEVFTGLSDGFDNCAAGSLCYSSDQQDKEGICIELCSDGLCSSGTCVVDNAGAFPVCLSLCDPLSSSCGSGLGCLPTGANAEFACHVLQEPLLGGPVCGMKNGCREDFACVAAEVGRAEPDALEIEFGYVCAEYCPLQHPGGDGCAVTGDQCVAVPSFGSEVVGVCQLL